MRCHVLNTIINCARKSYDSDYLINLYATCDIILKRFKATWYQTFIYFCGEGGRICFLFTSSKYLTVYTILFEFFSVKAALLIKGKFNTEFCRILNPFVQAHIAYKNIKHTLKLGNTGKYTNSARVRFRRCQIKERLLYVDVVINNMF